MLTSQQNKVSREKVFLFYSTNIPDSHLLPLDLDKSAFSIYLGLALVI